MNNGWIDISVSVHQGLVHWPGDPEFEAHLVSSLERNDPCNVTRISTSVHIGTHMDSPAHFLDGGAGIDQAPIDATIGQCRVIEISDPVAIRPGELEPYGLEADERILFKTRNSERLWSQPEFVEDFVYVSKEAAQFLVDRQVRTVGIDYLSVGGFFRDGVETHRILLGAGIWIIEGLNLSVVEPGRYELVCLPVKLLGSDGAPARAVLRPVQPAQ